MRNIKNHKNLAWMLVLAIVCSLVCQGVSTEVIAKASKTNTIKSVSLKIGNKKVDKKTYKMNQGEKKKLKVTVSPQKGKKTIKFTTGNKKIVTVSKNGTITAKKAGTVKIKVTVKTGKAKKTTWMKVRVTEPTKTPEATLSPEPTKSPDVIQSPTPTQSPDITQSPTPTESPTVLKKSIVVYFSCTDNTKKIAEYIAESTSADIYRIEPAVPYTSEDLDYGNADSRTSKEQNDTAARPEIAGALPNLNEYENVYIGYPIWWGQAPKIMYTFVESCNLSGKTVIPFCTSGSSGIGTSAVNLQAAVVSQATWLDGRRFAGSSPRSDVENWILELGI